MCVARPPHLPGPDSALPVDTGLRTRQARSNVVTEAPAMCVARPLHLPGPNTALPGTTGLRTRQARSSTVIGTARRNHAPLPHVTRWLWLQVQTRALHGSTVTGITGIWLLERTLPVTTGLTVQILTFLDTRDTHLPFFTGIAGIFPLKIAHRLLTRVTGTGITGIWLLELTLPVRTGLTVETLTFLDTRDTHLPVFTGIAGIFPLIITHRPLLTRTPVL